MRLRRPASVLAVTALLLAGCSGDGDGETQATAPTTTAAAVETPDELKNAVFERSYSDCASFSVKQLAATHAVQARRDLIAHAVASSWVERFGAGTDAVKSGKDGCLLGFRHAKSPPGSSGTG